MNHSNTIQTSTCDYLANLIANSINEKLHFKSQLMGSKISHNQAETYQAIIQRSYESHNIVQRNSNTTLHITLNMLSSGLILIESLRHRLCQDGTRLPYACNKCTPTCKIYVRDLSNHNKIIEQISNYAEDSTKQRNKCKVHGSSHNNTHANTT